MIVITIPRLILYNNNNNNNNNNNKTIIAISKAGLMQFSKYLNTVLVTF